MGVLCDYFRAPDRSTALAFVDDLFTAAEAHPDAEAVDLKGIDPVVILGKLVTLLSGRPYEQMMVSGDIPVDHIPGPELLTPEDGDVFLVELDVSVRDTLAGATEATLDDVAFVWANIEEFIGWRDTWNEADELRPIIDALVGIARRARAADQMLYCLICP
ncbi:hypothetical protein [Spirillospora sp. CA-128828]|uniref:hypothetical protein n=1 Tax=Spirillospora sp. CA-128828 TaxID=3240033 RepID=UPI003D8F6962